MRRHAKGQALVEFAIVAGVFVTLLLLIGLLARYLDVWASTEAASRYVAFEAQARHSGSGWKSDAELSAEVRRRFFSSSTAPIKTGDTAGDFKAHRNPYWSDHNGQPLIDDFANDVSVSTRKDGEVAIAAAEPWREALDFSRDNLVHAEVRARLAKVSRLAPFDELEIETKRKTVLLADTWTARSAGQVKDKITDATAMYPLGSIKPLVDLAGLLPPTIKDPALRLSDHDWDVVPCDRLKEGC